MRTGRFSSGLRSVLLGSEFELEIDMALGLRWLGRRSSGSEISYLGLFLFVDGICHDVGLGNQAARQGAAAQAILAQT